MPCTFVYPCVPFVCTVYVCVCVYKRVKIINVLCMITEYVCCEGGGILGWGCVCALFCVLCEQSQCYLSY